MVRTTEPSFDSFDEFEIDDVRVSQVNQNRFHWKAARRETQRPVCSLGLDFSRNFIRRAEDDSRQNIADFSRRAASVVARNDDGHALVGKTGDVSDKTGGIAAVGRAARKFRVLRPRRTQAINRLQPKSMRFFRAAARLIRPRTFSMRQRAKKRGAANPSTLLFTATRFIIKTKPAAR